jgi:branched-chain amino acid transport system substrate-binding protein
MGKVAAERKHRTAVAITWKYAAGEEMVDGFKEAFEKGGGKVIKDLTVPFPTVEWQSLITEIAATKPDIVYSFFAGAGAVKFVKDYAAAGLNSTIALYGPGSSPTERSKPRAMRRRACSRRCTMPTA